MELNISKQARTSPRLSGAPIRIEFRPELTTWRGKLLSKEDRGQPIHATSFLPQRLIVFESELLKDWSELSRILVHELFHFAWVRLGNPLRFVLTPGQRHDSRAVPELLDGLQGKALLADKAYDSDKIVQSAQEQGIEVIIPSKANRKQQRAL